MCRNIKTLANFAPPATDDEIRASALQFVRKLSGSNRPSRANELAFNRAVDEVTTAAQRLIASLTTTAPPRNRDEEARKAQERARERFAEHVHGTVGREETVKRLCTLLIAATAMATVFAAPNGDGAR